MLKKGILAIVICALLASTGVFAQRSGSLTPQNSVNLTVRTRNVQPSQLFINGQEQKVASYPFTVALAKGQVTVLAKAAGYQDFSVTVNLQANTNVDLNFQPITYNLTVNSNVKGAVVFLNNAQAGNVGSSFSIQPGKYEIRVSAPGYRDFTDSIQVSRNQTITANLQAATFNLTINSNVKGALVFLNNEQAGNTGSTFALEPGRYQVKISAPGYQDFATTVNLSANQTISATLNLATGTVVVELVKGSPIQVSIDGQRQRANETSFVLPAGSHTIKLEFAQLVAETTVNVVAGQAITVSPLFSIVVK